MGISRVSAPTDGASTGRTIDAALARQLEVDPPSPDRDELLARVRVRLVEVEAWEELGPPSSLPALADETAQALLPWFRTAGAGNTSARPPIRRVRGDGMA